jgi:MYXO-CTERM domain-containing protein
LFNNATQVVLMREGTRTVLSMQNNYEGPPSGFAMVVPVPVVLQKENVKTLPKDIFAKIDNLAAPRLVEYWEQDPCQQYAEEDRMVPMTAAPMGGAARADGAPRDLGVKIEAQFTVGEYEIVILSAKDSTGLDTWLRQQKYNIPEGAAPYLKPYVQSGSKFFVAKVDPSKVTFSKGMANLSPLRFHYDAETFALPVRLGLMNAKGPQDLIVHILARGQRYEVANYPNVTIPTNYDVSENARQDFGAFYAALFDKTLERNPKSVVTEYSWDASTCDPCPGPALAPADFATLGADALGPDPAPPAPNAPIRPLSPPRKGGATTTQPTPPAMPMRRPQFFGGFTITRLHARYTKESLGDDLVFRAAAPIVGGREFMSDDGKTLEHGSRPGSMNNFQGRYAIRHPWTGPITCEKPMRGRWGGPPESQSTGQGMRPMPAKDLAFAPRGGTPLASFLRSNVSELDIKAAGAPVSPVSPVASAAQVSPEPNTAPSAAPSSTPKSETNQGTVPPGSGCGSCSTGDTGDQGLLGGLFGALPVLLAAWRTRRKVSRARNVV